MEKLKPKIYLKPKELEEKMIDHKLCWKCRDYLKQKYGSNFFMAPSNHCHHTEPEPKPVLAFCKWCETWRQLKLTWHDTPFWKSLNYLINASDNPINECPLCGGNL